MADTEEVCVKSLGKTRVASVVTLFSRPQFPHVHRELNPTLRLGCNAVFTRHKWMVPSFTPPIHDLFCMLHVAKDRNLS